MSTQETNKFEDGLFLVTAWCIECKLQKIDGYIRVNNNYFNSWMAGTGRWTIRRRGLPELRIMRTEHCELTLTARSAR